VAFEMPILDFDPAAVREKYRIERDKRIRPEAETQYVEVKGAFAHYVDDPYVEPGFTRAPLTDEVDVAIIGGGFAGLLAGGRLREAGVGRVRIIEHGGDFGGTWYWNRYPGAQCDTESLIYLPLLEETGYMPTERYAHADEIRGHARRIGDYYGLYDEALFQTQLRNLRWLEDERRWLIETDRGDAMTARHVVITNGPMNRPKLPGIPGIERFKGHSFHTSRWDYGYTGGDSSGGLTKLADKRVGIIGTGATAIQCVPHLGRWAKQLYVFQRTPSSVDLRANRPTDPVWYASQAPGWQRRRIENFTTLTTGGYQEEDLVADGWTDIIREVASIAAYKLRHDVAALTDAEVASLMEIADFRKMRQIHARVDAIVEDPATAEALKPWYRLFCKRPTFNDDYLPTFNRPNVTLVDTGGKGVDRITETALVVDGTAYEVDCLVFATGFEVGAPQTRRTGYEVQGRNGATLRDHWKEGPRTLHGFYSAGFPNCFHMGVNHNTLTFNFPHLMEWQARHIADLISLADARGAATIEPDAQAEAGWVETIRANAINNQQFRLDCTPGYYNGEGRPGRGIAIQDHLYGPGPMRYFELVDAWRDEGMPGLTIS